MGMNYTKEVMKYFLNPKNVGKIKDASGVATVGSMACGDMITLYLKIDKQGKIINVKFKSYGCASNIATASKMTEMIKGKTIAKAKKLKWKTIIDELGGLPNTKVHCSVLAVDTLKKAIKNYEDKKTKKTKKEITQNDIFEILSKIINPEFGLSIVKLKMIEEIKISKKTIKIKINPINTDKNFYNVIKEDIKEHIFELINEKKYNLKIIGLNS